jgi:uncharacterized secreted protein with C-terminal beta-propeller domain
MSRFAAHGPCRVFAGLVVVGAALWLPSETSAAVRRRVVADEPKALAAIDSCDGLRTYLSEATTEELVRAWAGFGWYRGGGPSGFEDKGGELDFTTTNNQEDGVDEIDIVKTDGYYMYATRYDRMHIVRSWPVESASLVSSWPTNGSAEGLFLRNDLVLIASTDWSWIYRGAWGGSAITTLSLVDVTDRKAPRELRRIEIEGGFVGARMIDGHVFVVMQNYLWVPQEAWDLLWRRREEIGLPTYDRNASQEERERTTALARSILRTHVDQLFAKTQPEKTLPTLRDLHVATGVASTVPLVACSDLMRPTADPSLGLLSVLHLDLDAAEPSSTPVKTIGVLANGWTIYASKRSLYVSNTLPWWWFFGEMPRGTAIHAFELDPAAAKPAHYRASGTVPGYLLDQFAMGEHNGYLRVASTEFNWWWNSSAEQQRGSSVTVLKDDGHGHLDTVGQISGIEPEERIFASRFMGDVGYLITYEQIDPLFTLDLKDPSDPRIVGKLELPGVSDYLHPAGDGYLLAVGRAVDSAGRLSKVAVNLFDVRDLAHPKLAHTTSISGGEGSWSWSLANWDHHAFTFHRGVLSVPVQWYRSPGYFSGIVALSVDTEKGIRELGRVDHMDMSTYWYPPEMLRSIYVENTLYSLSTAGFKASELTRPENVLATIRFPADNR